MLTNFIIAQIIGIIALIILMISFQKNTKRKLLTYQIVSSFLYAIQYFFLKAYTGFFMSFTCMIRNYIFNRYKNKVPIYCLIIIILIMISFSILTYSGLISLLPMIAVVLYSFALWYGNLKIIRITEVISCSLFIIYNIKVSAITGLIATFIEMLAAIIAIYKFDIKNRRT